MNAGQLGKGGRGVVGLLLASDGVSAVDVPASFGEVFRAVFVAPAPEVGDSGLDAMVDVGVRADHGEEGINALDVAGGVVTGVIDWVVMCGQWRL